MMISPRHRNRILGVAFLFLTGMAALGYRLYDLQILSHEELSRAVNRLHERRVKLPAIRGMIVDCNENVLAHSVAVRTVVVDPQAVREDAQRWRKANRPPPRRELASVLSESLGLAREDVEQKLLGSGRYIVLKRKFPEDAARRLQEALREERFQGVLFEDDQTRIYPNHFLMSHVLGFVNSEQKGADGLEYLMENDLQGEDGWRRIEIDRRGREIVVYRNEDFAPRHGYTVVLTLDQALQNIVEQELDQAVRKHRPDSAVAIVMRPSTGEILALANRPTFDPNSSNKRIETLKNLAVADVHEPGSTFKIVTVATALDHRIVTLNDTIWCENGKFLFGGRYLNDHEPYGNLTVMGVLVHSSNIGSAKIALMLGNERMHRAMRNFGFGEKAFGEGPGEGWPGEVRGIVHPLRSWSKVSITRIAMGHEIAATPLQMASAMCALANGGNLMRPQIIKRVVDSNGNVVREFFPAVRRRVVDQKAAQQITEALKQVVSKEGTAAKAAISGFAVAGKTGTSQKLVNGQYVHDQYVASFSGYFPADDPEICIYAMLDNPKGKDKYGGAVAGPLFHDIGVRVASYLNMKPSQGSGSPDLSASATIPAVNWGAR